jgi:hypothetical protein
MLGRALSDALHRICRRENRSLREPGFASPGVSRHCRARGAHHRGPVVSDVRRLLDIPAPRWTKATKRPGPLCWRDGRDLPQRSLLGARENRSGKLKIRVRETLAQAGARRVLINRDCSAIAGRRKRRVRRNAQAIFCRRRRPMTRRTPQAKIRPGSPAPAMGPGTGNGFQPIDSIIANSGELVV